MYIGMFLKIQNFPLAQRIRFWRNTMEDSRIFSKKFMNGKFVQQWYSACMCVYSMKHLHRGCDFISGTTRRLTRRRRSGTSTAWLMTWWLMPWSLREDLCGPVKIMMETYSRILLLKVCAYSVQTIIYSVLDCLQSGMSPYNIGILEDSCP